MPYLESISAITPQRSILMLYKQTNSNTTNNINNIHIQITESFPNKYIQLLSADPGRRAAQLDHVSRLSGVTCLQWAEVRQVSTNAGRWCGPRGRQHTACGVSISKGYPTDFNKIYPIIK